MLLTAELVLATQILHTNLMSLAQQEQPAYWQQLQL
jgi:hypothetical protein